MSVDEPSIQESAESDQPAVRVVSGILPPPAVRRANTSVWFGRVRNCSMPMASSLNRPMCLPNASAMLTTTSVFWASCHRIGACSPSGSADVRLLYGRF